jgi:hypothetical protein
MHQPGGLFDRLLAEPKALPRMIRPALGANGGGFALEKETR